MGMHVHTSHSQSVACVRVQERVPHLLFYSVLLNRTVFYWLREAIHSGAPTWWMVCLSNLLFTYVTLCFGLERGVYGWWGVR